MELFLTFGVPLLLVVSAVVWRNWVLTGLAILSLLWCWPMGSLVIAFTSVRSGIYFPLWTGFLVGLALLLLRLKLELKSRALLALGVFLVSGLLFAWTGVSAYDWWTKGRFAKLEDRVGWHLYEPFAESNRLVKVTAPDEFRFAVKDLPRVHCAYALYPIGAAAVQALCPQASYKRSLVRPDASPRAYDELCLGWAPAILALAPSTNQLAMAERKNLTYEMTPVARDAFVFFVPVTNPIESLTSDQVRGIYSGRITTWRELGVGLDAKLMAFQRNPDSGSQTALERLMGEMPIMPPIKEDRLGGMGGIISVAADYRNYPGALGFSFRYYLQDLVKEDKVKVLKIDGVAPTPENVRNGSYPFVETAYLITARPRTENLRRLADFLTGPVGRDMVEKTGYVLPPEPFRPMPVSTP